MATEELGDAKEWHVLMSWRNEQKEKERERRRIRDRLRRQTMSNEEREKHLARRRRNYQLRRQKVLNNSSVSTLQHYDSTTSAGYSNEEENQAIAPFSGLGVQLSDAAFCPELCTSQEEQADASSTLHQGVEERRYKVQRSPNILPLYQIRHLARLLNNSLSSDNQETETNLMSKDNVNRESRSRQRIRLIDVKRLARALNAN